MSMITFGVLGPRGPSWINQHAHGHLQTSSCISEFAEVEQYPCYCHFFGSVHCWIDNLLRLVFTLQALQGIDSCQQRELVVMAESVYVIVAYSFSYVLRYSFFLFALT